MECFLNMELYRNYSKISQDSIMISKLTQGYRGSKYSSLVVSFITTVAFLIIVSGIVLILSCIVAVLLPFMGGGLTVALIGFLFLWFLIHNVLQL